MRATALAATLALLAGCSFDATIPEGALVRCDGPGQCPVGYHCLVEAGRCLADQSADSVAPGLVGVPEVVPSFARVGAELRVTFEVSEPLLFAPPVFLQATGAVAALEAEASASASQRLVYRYTVLGTEGEGLAFLSTTLHDAAGNETRNLLLGNTTLDFTPPGAATDGFVTEPAVSAPRAAVLVRFVATEPIADSLLLEVAPVSGGAAVSVAPRSVAGPIATFVFPAPEAAGTYLLSAKGVEDLAGNQTATITGKTLVVDDVAPRIGALAVERPRYSTVAGFNLVRLGFTLDEAPQQLEVLVAGRAASCSPTPAGGGAVSCERAVDATDAEGPAFVTVTARDAVGNASNAQALITFDFTPPAVLAGTVDLAIAPPSGLPIGAVEALAVGGRAVVRFNVSEDLAVDPRVFAPAPDPLDFTLVQRQFNFFQYQHELVAGPRLDGAREVRVTLEDLVGNQSSAALVLPAPGLVVDVTPPAAPSVDAADLIVLTRKLWGDGASPQARFELRGGAGAAEGRGTLIAWSGPTVPRVEFGRTAVDATGAFPLLTMASQGSPSTLYLGFFDSAGNGSPVVAVKNLELVASLAGKVPNDLASNPHVVEVRSQLYAGPAQEVKFQRGGGEISVPDGGALRAQTDGRWLSAAGAGASPAATAPSVAFDSRRGVLVFFGGARSADGGYPQTVLDLWEYDGERWRRRQSGFDPLGPANGGAGLGAFDRIRGRTVVLEDDSVFEWSGASWQRSSFSEVWGMQAAATWADRAVLYSVTQGALSFQGAGFAPLTGIDGGLAPSGVATPLLATDSQRELLWLLGASSPDKVWAFDGGAWAQATLSDPESDGNPAPDPGAQLVWDGNRSQPLWVTKSEVWEWTGRSWRQVAISDPEGDGEPTVAAGFRAAWFPPRRSVLLVGGRRSDGVTPPQTWEWTGSSWKLLLDDAPEDMPVDRSGAAMGFDPSTGRTTFFGGSFDLPGDSTYFLKRFRWSRDKPLGPSARTGFSPGLAFGDGGALLFGGEFNATPFDEAWWWSDGGWTQRAIVVADGGSSPGKRAGHATVWDPQRGVFVISGGSGLETWEVGAAGWTRATAVAADAGADPSNLVYGCSAFDSVRGRVLYFSGYRYPGGAFTDLQFEWTGSSWERVFPIDPEGDGNPARRYGAASAGDPRRGRVYVFGGATPSNPYGDNDLWEWNGQSWRKVLASDPEGDGFPFVRTYPSASFDSAAGQLVMHGGFTFGFSMNDTWVLEPGDGRRPAVVLHFDLSAIPSTAQLQEARLTALAGGAGDQSTSSPASVPGAALFLWSHDDGWVQVGANAAPAPAPLVATVPAGPLLRAAIPDARTLAVAITPVGVTAWQRAQVTADFSELLLRYRLP